MLKRCARQKLRGRAGLVFPGELPLSQLLKSHDSSPSKRFRAKGRVSLGQRAETKPRSLAESGRATFDYVCAGGGASPHAAACERHITYDSFMVPSTMPGESTANGRVRTSPGGRSMPHYSRAPRAVKLAKTQRWIQPTRLSPAKHSWRIARREEKGLIFVCDTVYHPTAVTSYNSLTSSGE